MKKKKLKCYIYIRVSTSMQVEGYSLEAQRERLTKFADFQDIEIVREYCDAGKSGKNITGRPEFSQMLNDVAEDCDGVDFILVFKLSRFGRNAADVLNSLQYIQDFGVNLICMEDGIDSSKDSGKLTITVLSAVAEIERENILVQTMEGRRQKAREGKWNGGQAPFGYMLDSKNSTLIVNPEEAEIGKIVYGRHKTEKVKGSRDEYKRVMADDYMVVDGMHEAIIDRELWEATRLRRKDTGVKWNKTHSMDHEHILTGIIKCPICGRSLVGTVRRRKNKKSGEYKDDWYYKCLHRTKIDETHFCDFRLVLSQVELNSQVEQIILDMVADPQFKDYMVMKMDEKVDVSSLENERDQVREQLRQVVGAKKKLAEMLDRLDVSDKHYDRKYQDMHDRLDILYDRISELEDAIAEIEEKISGAYGEKITANELYKVLLSFDRMYFKMTDLEKKRFMREFIDEIELYPERQEDGRILKQLHLGFPVVEVQRSDKGAGRKRARYNSSMMDANLLKKGEDFDKLPETWVIFITENDVMGKGLPLYPVERCFLGTGERFEDGSHILYINGAYRSDTPVGKLMHDFSCTDAADMYYGILADRVRFFKESKEGIEIMCRAMEDMRNQTLKEGAINSAKRMLADGILTLEKIAEYAGLPLDEVKKLKAERTA